MKFVVQGWRNSLNKEFILTKKEATTFYNELPKFYKIILRQLLMP